LRGHLRRSSKCWLTWGSKPLTHWRSRGSAHHSWVRRCWWTSLKIWWRWPANAFLDQFLSHCYLVWLTSDRKIFPLGIIRRWICFILRYLTPSLMFNSNDIFSAFSNDRSSFVRRDWIINLLVLNWRSRRHLIEILIHWWLIHIISKIWRTHRSRRALIPTHIIHLTVLRRHYRTLAHVRPIHTTWWSQILNSFFASHLFAANS